MAATAVALVGSAGVAGYATSADTREETSTVSHTPTFTPHFESAAFQIPHPEKQHKGGEDTFLVSSNGLVLGVFDGTTPIYFDPHMRELPQNWCTRGLKCRSGEKRKKTFTSVKGEKLTLRVEKSNRHISHEDTRAFVFFCLSFFFSFHR